MKQDIRKDFPMLEGNIIYFDNSSTSLKPYSVLESITEFYTKYTSNAYRGSYINSEYISLKIYETRELVATMLNCSPREVIFTSNCTDSINQLVRMLNINKRTKVICSLLEHHSNYLPWLKNANILTVNLNDDGTIDLIELEKLLKENKVKLVSITALSNVTGNVQPIKEICQIAHKYKTLVNLDCCQFAPHYKINVKDIDCDFLTLSAHKMCGPSGLGVIYGKKDLLLKCKKAKYGGGMVDRIIDNEDIKYKEIPYCFEAGTPAIENILGFASAIRYYLSYGYDNITKRNKELNDYFYKKILASKNIELIFPISKKHAPIFTFKLKNKDLNLNYVAKILSDSANICVSSGYQCCQPLYNSMKEKGGIRVSLQFYNTEEEIDYFFNIIDNLKI